MAKKCHGRLCYGLPQDFSALSKPWDIQVLPGAVEILWALLSSTFSIIYGPAVYLWLASASESDRDNVKDNDDADADESE